MLTKSGKKTILEHLKNNGKQKTLGEIRVGVSMVNIMVLLLLNLLLDYTSTPKI